MKRSEHSLDKDLIKELEDLEREYSNLLSCYMFDGKDKADTIYTDVMQRYQLAKRNAEKLLASRRSERIYSPKRYTSGQRMQNKKITLGALASLRTNMKRTSKLRAGVGTISTLAYMTAPPSNCRNSTVRPFEWKMKAYNPSPSDRWLSPWTVLGYDKSQFGEWWENRLALCKLSDPVEQEWKDMQALSNGIVLLLNILGLEDICRNNENSSLSQYMLELSSLLERLGVKLYELLAYPECFSVTSELFGFAAAMVFVALKLFNSIQAFLSEQKNGPAIHDSHRALEYYERQVQLLYGTATELMENSERVYNEASNSKVVAVVLRSDHLAEQMVSSKRLDGEATEEEVDRAGIHLKTVRSFDISDMKALLIPEIRLSCSEGRQIGFGSSSVVFERCLAGRQRRYAVKEPSGVTEFNVDALWNKIGREAQIWRQLNHENIVALRGFCILSNALPGLVMDVYHWNLKDFVRENSLSVGDSLELLHGASRGISYLHSENIAHGDLRACNILVKENELGKGFTALLADFGTAYFVNDAASPHGERKFQTTHNQVGNIGWLSPELLRKKESPNEEDTNEPIISIHGDMYSFGCVFLEVIHNRIPYQGCVSDSVKKQKILQGLPPASREETGDDYYEFLSSMWNVVPDQRPCADSVSGQIVNFLQAV